MVPTVHSIAAIIHCRNTHDRNDQSPTDCRVALTLAHDPRLLTLCCSAGLTANVIGSALGIQPRLRVRLDRPEMDGQEGAAFGLPLPVSALLLSGIERGSHDITAPLPTTVASRAE